MKKLMIAAAIAVVSVVASAATFEWSADGYNSVDWNGQYMEGGVIAYLYVGDTVTASDKAFNFGTATAVDFSGQDTETYNFGAGKQTAGKLGTVTSDAGDQPFSIILVEDNGKSLANYEGHYAIVTGDSAHMTNPMDESDTWVAFTSTKELAQGDWKAMAAPEPTSGLLLLLGVAGLALKRKRA